MLKWGIGIIVVLAIGGGFSWWRLQTLHTLPPPEAGLSTSTTELPPVTASRENLLKFEQEILALKAKRLDSVTTTSVARSNPSNQAPLPIPPRPASSTLIPSIPASSVPTPPIQEVVPGVPSLTPRAPTSTAISTAKAPSPPPLQQFLVDGSGFCAYIKGVSAIVISGYPLAADITIPDDNIKTWTTTRVVFLMPEGVPPGTYRVTVRGRDSWGYCTATNSSPVFIKVL